MPDEISYITMEDTKKIELTISEIRLAIYAVC